MIISIIIQTLGQNPERLRLPFPQASPREAGVGVGAEDVDAFVLSHVPGCLAQGISRGFVSVRFAGWLEPPELIVDPGVPSL